MRLIRVAAVLLLVGLSACANRPDLENPLNRVNIQRVELGYATALQLAVDWRKFCWERSYAVLMQDPVGKYACVNRRATLRAIQKGRAVTGKAVREARDWARANPTIDTGALIDAAWRSIVAFQSDIPKVK